MCIPQRQLQISIPKKKKTFKEELMEGMVYYFCGWKETWSLIFIFGFI